MSIAEPTAREKTPMADNDISDAVLRDLDDIDRQLEDNLADAAALIEAGLKAALSYQGSENDRSVPGEYPRRQSGKLMASVEADPDVATGEISIWATAPYAGYVELSRPFIDMIITDLDAQIEESLLKGFEESA